MRFARAFQPRTPRIRISISLYRRTIVSAAAYASLIVSSFLRDTILYIYFFFFSLFSVSFFSLSLFFFSFLFTEFTKSRSGLRAEFLELAFLIRTRVFFYNSLLIIKNRIPFPLLVFRFFFRKIER